MLRWGLTGCSQLDALIHIDAEELEYVYEWRLQQEHKLILRTGMGMSDEKLRKFIDCCKLPSTLSRQRWRGRADAGSRYASIRNVPRWTPRGRIPRRNRQRKTSVAGGTRSRPINQDHGGLPTGRPVDAFNIPNQTKKNSKNTYEKKRI